jgi:hypothetical protein
MRVLEQIEWHDLPISKIELNETGIEIIVTPYNEDEQDYEYFALKVSGYSTVKLSVEGILNIDDQKNLEISSFEYQLDELNLVSGVIGILPGNAGFWTIDFTKATCRLEQINN